MSQCSMFMKCHGNQSGKYEDVLSQTSYTQRVSHLISQSYVAAAHLNIAMYDESVKIKC